jgi:hypothetical protein
MPVLAINEGWCHPVDQAHGHALFQFVEVGVSKKSFTLSLPSNLYPVEMKKAVSAKIEAPG